MQFNDLQFQNGFTPNNISELRTAIEEGKFKVEIMEIVSDSGDFGPPEFPKRYSYTPIE